MKITRFEVEEVEEDLGHWTMCLSLQECNRECEYTGQACGEKRNDEAISYTSE